MSNTKLLDLVAETYAGVTSFYIEQVVSMFGEKYAATYKQLALRNYNFLEDKIKFPGKSVALA